MMATLLLRLAAPLQSWGSDSKFEIRKTNREPTKSGIIGLLAAALGIARDDDQAIQRLNGLRFAVRVDQEGQLLMDYHTANNPAPAQIRESRKLGKTPNPPYVTRRYYLADAIFLVGLESKDERMLQQLQQALTHPAYPLFLGRRSCPPTLPFYLGIRPTDLFETLEKEPSQVPAWRHHQPVKTRIVADAIPSQPGVAPRQDLPISFSPIHRQFGFRPVREFQIQLVSGPVSQSETSHDPFVELR
jgi:CRISPR system Cascade subunit CasD